MSRLKKYFAAGCCCLLFAAGLSAQSFGASAYALAFFPKNPDIVDARYGNERVVGHMSPVAPGIRIEANYILPGYSIPVSGFNGIGISYFFPHQDSALFRPYLNNGDYIQVLGIKKVSMTQINFRFAYEIPQSFNDFLLLHFGWGMGFMRTKSLYLLPDQSATFPYTSTDFRADFFLPQKKGQFVIDILAGGVYEFEHFSAIAQYSFIFGIDNNSGERFRHGMNLGIYYPLKRFE